MDKPVAVDLDKVGIPAAMDQDDADAKGEDTQKLDEMLREADPATSAPR